MVDWLVAWGVTQAVGFVFKPILEDLAKDAAKDFAKDFLKDSLKHVLLTAKEPLDIAIGKAIKEFLQLVQQQLEVADLSEAQQKLYTEPLKQFLKNKSIKEVLGSAFKDDCQGLDTKNLAKIWNELNLLPLPDEFSWKQVAKLYLNKVKAIIRESPELRSILDSQNIEATAQNTKELAGIVPGFELEQYQEGIRERYGNLNLQSLYTTGAAYNELKLWRIFIAQNVREFNDVLPQVHELPKEHLRQLKESNHLEREISSEQLEQYKRSYFEQPIRSVLDVINDSQTYQYVVILGDPGSGKSTLLQFLALNWAESPLNNVISLPIPLLIELRTYMRNFDSGHCKDFLEFFHKSPGSICRLNQHQLDEQLKAGKALVMFDGLDEVFDPGKREDAITCIHRFTNEYPNVRVIVTSRVIGYKHQRLRDAQFRHFMLQDLDEKQINDFLDRWHKLTFNDEADKVRKRERLQRAIETSTAIGELAGNPLLLTMMAILNRHQELPRDRNEKFAEELIDYLIELNIELNIEPNDENELYYDYCQASDGMQMWLHRFSLAANCLSEVRNRSMLVSIDNKLLKALKDFTEYLAGYALHNVAYTLGDQEITFGEIHAQAVSVIATTWRSHAETLPWLKTLARSGFSGAVTDLARGWKNDSETLPILKSMDSSKIA